MISSKLVKIMSNFSEHFLKELLGDLNDSLIEWTVNGESMTKKNKIEIIIGVYGLSLFEKEDFRYNFVMAIEDDELINKLSTKLTIAGARMDEKQIALASKIKQIQFGDNPIYRYIIRDYLEYSDFVFPDKRPEEPVDCVLKPEKAFLELFDYQYMIKQQVFNDISNPQKNLYKVLIHMPTGTGKTKTTMHIISQYLNFVTKGKGTIVWIAHSNELLLQAYDTFKKVWNHLAFFNINIYKGWIKFPVEIKDGFLFTSIQALQQKMNKPIFKEICDKASLIIFDEVHKSFAPKTKQCIDELMKKANIYGKKFIGLTATPGRTTEVSQENKKFSMDFDNIIGIDVDRINSISLSINEVRNYRGSKEPIKYFQENRYLAKIEKQSVDFTPSADIVEMIQRELKNHDENYSNELIEKVANNKARNMKIVEKLKDLNDSGVPTIVFACSVQHAKMLSAFLKLIDIPNSLVYGDMSAYEREKSIADFKNNSVNIIINYEILTTGFDSTNIRCVFITRPTKSVILYSQMIGRGLRGPRMGGNEKCLLLDVKENLFAFDENKAFVHFNNYWQ